MNHLLQFDFLVDKEMNTITVQREFRAGRQLVWDCHTKSELLEQWFAPKPLTAKTKYMDFSPGGRWHYAMIEPNGTAHWGLTEYQAIQAIDYYTSLDAFCNAAGEINEELPRARWVVSFSDCAENTLVETVITYQSLADLEMILQMGMKEGLTATLERLDELIVALNI